MTSDRSGRRMVQTVLNFGQDQKQAAVTYPSIRKPDRDEMAALESDSNRMEDVQPTQSTAISWESTPAPTSRSGSFSGNYMPASIPRHQTLIHVARETTALLPNILSAVPHAPAKGYLYTDPPYLDQKYSPRFPRTPIRILNSDTLDTAIGLAQCAKYVTVRDKRPVCVLNMANAYNAGGGWKRGALAQEEAICYRSSLSFTLKLRYYPIPELSAIYSPTVLVIRKSLEDGHELLPLDMPANLPIVSAISVAALCAPKVTMGPAPPGSKESQRQKYRSPKDRELTKEKMRVVLRTAAVNGHRRLVLGALGCGAFKNPREEVADCWAEVFGEQEFAGGWWESVLFAVMDDLGQGENGDGNYGVFYRRLNGMMV
ncbi:TIGR02452 family protein [Coccidioides immitis RS]|uniref:TIGR02452 family protein n=1 Tax=Coccidioides immitis (strain RS) TaxID=246410 RepID=UPI00028A424C|nr:TIGR02452 family protein [Coccidioides immitis RS]EAS36272.3 TIGR02452 family protein [Coccidioides immitis RS]TPX25595.1 hypothetical protein DIZ76_011050 [Coccidioides immitis]